MRRKLRLERFPTGAERAEPSRNCYIGRNERGEMLLTIFFKLINFQVQNAIFSCCIWRGGSVWRRKFISRFFFFFLQLTVLMKRTLNGKGN